MLLLEESSRRKVNEHNSTTRNNTDLSGIAAATTSAGVQVWEEHIESDEIGIIDGMRVTTSARTALDLARRYPKGVAVAAVDALAQATELKLADGSAFWSQPVVWEGMSFPPSASRASAPVTHVLEADVVLVVLLAAGVLKFNTSVPVFDPPV